MKVPIRASKIQPRLHNHQWAHTARLSTDGFCDNPAMLNLSHDLCMGLHSGKVTLSYRALAEVGLTTRQAWDQSATNLLKCATTPEGIRFDLRDAETTTTIASSALEIRVPGAPITAWLAHPQTFTVLNRHLELRLGPAPLYLARIHTHSSLFLLVIQGSLNLNGGREACWKWVVWRVSSISFLFIGTAFLALTSQPL